MFGQEIISVIHGLQCCETTISSFWLKAVEDIGSYFKKIIQLNAVPFLYVHSLG
jgi:hypothetical protein